MPPNSNNPRLDLRFGTELELLVKSKTDNHETFESLAPEVSAHLTQANVMNHITKLLDKDDEKYREWSIIDEVSITTRPRGFLGLELVSPVLVFSQQLSWKRQVHSVWSALNNGFDVRTNTQCSTHIHLSPVYDTWTLGQVKAVALAAVYFERCIDALMPDHRRVNYWCRSNRWNQCFKPLSMTEIFDDIKKQPTIEKVAERMCWCPKNLLTGRVIVADAKRFRWNLFCLNTPKGTIEFRQPPASHDSKHTMAWIMFTVSFIRWAIHPEGAGKLEPLRPALLSNLLDCVIKGAQLCHVQDLAPVRMLFKGVEPLPEGPLVDWENLSP